MTTVKNEVFIGLLHENVYLVRKELLAGEEIVRGAEWMSKFLVIGGIIPYPPVGKTLIYIRYIYIYIYIYNII